MEAVLGYRQAYISQHLAVLREAGLIDDRRDGWNVFYRVTAPQVFTMMDEALQIMGEQKSAVERPDRIRDKTCPCPKCNPVVEGAKT